MGCVKAMIQRSGSAVPVVPAGLYDPSGVETFGRNRVAQSRFHLLEAAVVALLAIAGSAGYRDSRAIAQQAAPQAVPQTPRPLSQRPPEPVVDRLSFAPMLDKVIPAVVSIRIKAAAGADQHPLLSHPQFGKLLREDLKGGPPDHFVSKGSGVVVDAEKGLIVTNFHVIERADEVIVRLADGREYPSQLVGRDPASDVALLRIDARDLVALPVGASREVRVGDVVVAVGHPLGQDTSASMGMVSAVRRTTVGYRNFEGYIQHDAPVNAGSSGGPLVSLKGELIGINTAILSPTAGNVGLGFALPSGLARRIWEQLARHGKVRRGLIGVRVEDVTIEIARMRGLKAPQGAIVKHVQEGTSAKRAGLLEGDILIAATVVRPSVFRMSILHAAHLDTMVAVQEIGSEIVLDLERQGSPVRVSVQVEDIRPEPVRLTIPSSVVRMAGVVVESLEFDDAMFGVVKGIEVVDVPKRSLAEFLGLRAGDIIAAVDQDKVRKPDDLLRQIKDRHEKFDLHIVREGIPLRVVFPL